MSADAHALLAAVRADPDDDLPRLVLADWLSENGDPDRGEFVRVQVDLAHTPGHDPARSALEDREHELLAANERRWLSDLDADGLAEWEFRRGFLHEVHATPRYLLEHGADLFAAHPVTYWRVAGGVDVSADDLVAVGRATWFDRLRGLDLVGCPLTVGQLDPFLTGSGFGPLRELDVSGVPGFDALPAVLGRAPYRHTLTSLRCGSGPGEPLDVRGLTAAVGTAPLAELAVGTAFLDAADLAHLLAAPFARTLSVLDLADNVDLGPDGWRAFETTPARLRSLDLSGTPLGAIALDRVLSTSAVRDLDRLYLNRCGSAVANLAAVARSRFWRQAVGFHVHAGTAPAFGLSPLWRGLGPAALRTLDLGTNFARDVGVRELCDAPWAGGLTWLSLEENYLSDDGLKTVAGCGRFSTLRTLHVGRNNPWYEGGGPGETVSDVGVAALAGSGSLSRMRVLTAGETTVSPVGLNALLHGPHWRLSGLGLPECVLHADAFRLLARSPRLARLEWLDLSGLGVGPDGDPLLPLAESPYLSPTLELDLRGSRMSDRVRAAFRERLGRRVSW